MSKGRVYRGGRVGRSAEGPRFRVSGGVGTKEGCKQVDQDVRGGVEGDPEPDTFSH